MKHIVLAFAVVTGTALATSAPASAQYYSVADILPPQEATAIVREAGLQPISRPVWRPGRYILNARDRYGRTLRVVVDARMGEVIRAVPVDTYAAVRPRYEPYPRAYPYPPEPYDPEEAVPVPPADIPYDGEYDDLPPPDATPRVIPGPRSAAPSASKSAALTPKPELRKSTPLPRARPADATASARPEDSASDRSASPEKAPESTSAIGAETKPAASGAAPAGSAPAAKNNIRIIDMSKPKPAETAKDKTAATESAPAPAATPVQQGKPSGPEVKPLEDSAAKPRF